MRALALLLVGLCASIGHAHSVGISRGEYRVDGDAVRAEIVFAHGELSASLPSLDRDALGAWLRRGLLIDVPAGRCTPTLVDARPTDQDGFALDVLSRCPEAPSTFTVRFELLSDLSLGHRHLLTAGASHDVLYAAHPTFTSTARPVSVAPSLFRLGIEHILTGYDHLLFLFALILVGGPLRAILGMVTAFTLAHSVTLAVAALGIWSPGPRLIEPAIALSVAYVGVENCFAPDVGRRWRLTFLFGLIHGFGFAGALREVAVSAAQLPFALASFNVGVEAGQLGVLAMVLPTIALVRRREWFPAGVQVASMAITAVGLCWFVARVAGG